MSCPHDNTAVRTCGSAERPMCDPCTNEWMVGVRQRAGTPTVNPWCGAVEPDTPCAGIASATQRPFKPGEDPLSDKTRSTLGRLFEGDITE